MRALAFGVVSPLLLWGIWILSHESSLDSRAFRPLLPEFKSTIVGRLIFTSVIACLLFIFVVDIRSLSVFLPILLSLITWALYHARRDQLARAKRRNIVDQELPIITQVLAILVTSGISPIRALDILSQQSHSLIAREFLLVIDDVKDGQSVVSALDRLGSRGDSTIVRRFASTLAMALDRGSPLADVLVEFIRDARHQQRMTIQRKAGKAEIALMIPVVFLILPLSVLFALWPSLTRLIEIA